MASQDWSYELKFLGPTTHCEPATPKYQSIFDELAQSFESNDLIFNYLQMNGILWNNTVNGGNMFAMPLRLLYSGWPSTGQIQSDQTTSFQTTKGATNSNPPDLPFTARCQHQVLFAMSIMRCLTLFYSRLVDNDKSLKLIFALLPKLCQLHPQIRRTIWPSAHC